MLRIQTLYCVADFDLPQVQLPAVHGDLELPDDAVVDRRDDEHRVLRAVRAGAGLHGSGRRVVDDSARLRHVPRRRLQVRPRLRHSNHSRPLPHSRRRRHHQGELRMRERLRVSRCGGGRSPNSAKDVYERI